MKLPLLLLALLAAAPLKAATVLASYSGGVNPTTQSWIASPNSNTNVVGSTYNDDGRLVWRIYDPGLPRPSTDLPANNLNYQKSITNTQISDLRANGWILSATVSMPVADPNPNVALATSSDSWIGFIHANPDGSASRVVYGFNIGRSATGQTLVSVNGLSGSTVTLDPGYHDLKMVFDPLTQLTSVYIDDTFLKSYTGSISASTGSQVVYWGDNASQNVEAIPRATYYESISLVMVPEPGVLSLGLLACAGFMLFYRRR